MAIYGYQEEIFDVQGGVSLAEGTRVVLSAEETVNIAGAASACIGVVTETNEAGKRVKVALFGVFPGIAAAAVTPGVFLKGAASGQVAIDASVANAEFVAATTAAAGQVIKMYGIRAK